MQHPKVGKTFSFGSGSFEILAPSKIETKGSNNNSVAIKLVNGQNSFVFTGDAVGSGYTVGIPTSRKTVKSNIENYLL